MSSVPVFAEPEELRDLVLDTEKEPERDYAIIDVRDSDFKGGHIPGAKNVPANQMYDKVGDLVREYADVPIVYFHCALSQVRGIYKQAKKKKVNEFIKFNIRPQVSSYLL
ncbi:hypothetical protein EDC94DRAFT_515649 [Helicostylum pulchrum]|nr:hypothetical protein EDC94DRAFT_515649 [Helicostylum pulchrum]